MNPATQTDITIKTTKVYPFLGSIATTIAFFGGAAAVSVLVGLVWVIGVKSTVSGAYILPILISVSPHSYLYLIPVLLGPLTDLLSGFFWVSPVTLTAFLNQYRSIFYIPAVLSFKYFLLIFYVSALPNFYAFLCLSVLAGILKGFVPVGLVVLKAVSVLANFTVVSVTVLPWSTRTTFGKIRDRLCLSALATGLRFYGERTVSPVVSYTAKLSISLTCRHLEWLIAIFTNLVDFGHKNPLLAQLASCSGKTNANRGKDYYTPIYANRQLVFPEQRYYSTKQEVWLYG